MNKTPAQRIALWADQLRDISAMGLIFCKNFHDRESFRRVQDIAIKMLALAIGEPLEHIEPLRAPIFSHPTPFAVGDAAIIDDDGNILLIQRAETTCGPCPAVHWPWAKRPPRAWRVKRLRKPGCGANPSR